MCRTPCCLETTRVISQRGCSVLQEGSRNIPAGGLFWVIFDPDSPEFFNVAPIPRRCKPGGGVVKIIAGAPLPPPAPAYGRAFHRRSRVQGCAGQGGPPLRFHQMRGESPPPNLLREGGGRVYPPYPWMSITPIFGQDWIIPLCWFPALNRLDAFMTPSSKQPNSLEAEGGGYPHPPPMPSGGSIPLRKFLQEGGGGEGSPPLPLFGCRIVWYTGFRQGRGRCEVLREKTHAGFCAAHVSLSGTLSRSGSLT